MDGGKGQSKMQFLIRTELAERAHPRPLSFPLFEREKCLCLPACRLLPGWATSRRWANIERSPGLANNGCEEGIGLALASMAFCPPFAFFFLSSSFLGGGLQIDALFALSPSKPSCDLPRLRAGKGGLHLHLLLQLLQLYVVRRARPPHAESNAMTRCTQTQQVQRERREKMENRKKRNPALLYARCEAYNMCI